MSQPYTAALVGGPLAGEVRVTPNGGEIVALEFPELPVFAAIDDHAIDPKRVYYTRRLFDFFGLPINLWIEDGLWSRQDTTEGRHELASQVGAHLLSPLGLQLAREATR